MIPGGRDSKIFTGVMDKDTEGRYLGAGNYRNLLNARSSINSEGSFGAIEDVMGNVLVNNPYLTNGRNKVIGSYEDIAGQSCIFFVWNEFGYHGIYRWYANRVGFPNGVIEKIYQVADPSSYDQFNPNPLNFQENSLIVGVNLVDDLLCWTDDFNSPKLINIEKANETNKKRKFYLYFNQNTFGVFSNGLTHSLKLYVEGQLAPLTIFSWVMPVSVSNYYEAVDNLITQYNNSSSSFSNFATITNNKNYATVEINTVGIYTLEWTNNAPPLPQNYSGLVVPANFYPDKTNTTYSYSPTSYQLIERIKYPPMCDPNASFNITGVGFLSFNLRNINLQNQYQFPPPPLATGDVFYTFYYYSGISSIISDTFNIVNTGANVIVTPSQGGYGVFNGYIENTLPYPITLNLNIQLSITLNGWAGITSQPNLQPDNQAFNINLGVNTNSSVPPSPLQQIWAWNSSLAGAGEFDPPTLYNVVVNKQWTLQPGQKLGIYSTSSGIIGSFTGAISGTVINSSLNFSETAQFPQFRAKYIYNEYQNSVYGAISPVAVSPSFKYNNINIDYTDIRLEIPELVCDIKNVVLAVSLDAGVTWNEFATLDPYNFAGFGRQKYFYNINEVLITIPTSESILQYHNVPKKSKSQEYIGDRIWDGKLLTGYNTIDVDLEVSVNYEDIFNDPQFLAYQTQRPFITTTRWKRGWKGKIGIVYYDNADRKCAVCLDAINSDVEIPYYNVTNDLNPAYLKININSEPPAWAVKYQFVRSQNTLCVNYLIWCADYINLVDDNDNVVSPSLAKYIKIKLDNIPYYTDKAYKGAEISFTYVQGDRIRFIMNSNSVFYPVNDYVISSVIGSDVYIVYDNSINPTNGSVIEIYTPSPSSDKLLFYEFGECYPIETITINNNKVKRHNGNVQNQIYQTQPAIVDIKTGDVWYRSRDLYYNTAGVVTFQTRYISSQTPSEYTATIFNNNSRTNTTDLLGEIQDDSAFLFSDIYLSNTQINGLSAVQPLNYKKLNTTYGPLNKMQVINNDVLKLVFGNSYQLSIYVSQGVIRQTQGAGNLISLSDEVAGNSHIIQRTLGTINAESVVLNDEGDMFGYDENEGVVWVSSGNGLIQVSDRGMKSIFKRYSNERKATGGISEVPSVYDLYHDEYIITLGSMDGFVGVTIAYNKQKQGWTSYYSFVPEYYGRVRDYIVSFKDGELWAHDRNVLAKNFYGVQYSRELTYVSNKDFPKVKDFKAISINGIGLNNAPTIRILPFQGYLSGMLSSLSKRFFKVLEGIQYAHFQKDKLSPGFGGNQLQALANGRNLKGQVIEVTLVNDDTAKSSIYSSDIVYFYSEHS